MLIKLRMSLEVSAQNLVSNTNLFILVWKYNITSILILNEVYSLTPSLRQFFNNNMIKDAVRLSLARWYDKVEKSGYMRLNMIYLYESSEQV